MTGWAPGQVIVASCGGKRVSVGGGETPVWAAFAGWGSACALPGAAVSFTDGLSLLLSHTGHTAVVCR